MLESGVWIWNQPWLRLMLLHSPSSHHHSDPTSSTPPHPRTLRTFTLLGAPPLPWGMWAQLPTLLATQNMRNHPSPSKWDLGGLLIHARRSNQGGWRVVNTRGDPSIGRPIKCVTKTSHNENCGLFSSFSVPVRLQPPLCPTSTHVQYRYIEYDDGDSDEYDHGDEYDYGESTTTAMNTTTATNKTTATNTTLATDSTTAADSTMATDSTTVTNSIEGTTQRQRRIRHWPRIQL